MPLRARPAVAWEPFGHFAAPSSLDSPTPHLPTSPVIPSVGRLASVALPSLGAFQNTLYATKRLIGRKFSDKEVKGVAKLVPYEIVKADNSDDAWVAVNGQKMSPSQVRAACGLGCVRAPRVCVCACVCAWACQPTTHELAPLWCGRAPRCGRPEPSTVKLPVRMATCLPRFLSPTHRTTEPPNRRTKLNGRLSSRLVSCLSLPRLVSLSSSGRVDGAREDEGDGGGLPRARGFQGGRHGAGVLQRLAAPGDQGRGPHRGPRRPPHHQRADRRRARVRHGQGARETNVCCFVD